MKRNRHTGGSFRIFISFIAVLLANFTLCFPRMAACSFTLISLEKPCLPLPSDNREDSVSVLPMAAASIPDSVAVPAKVWSLQDCIDYARENNLQVHTARLNQQSAEVQLKSAKASRCHRSVSVPPKALPAGINTMITGSL